MGTDFIFSLYLHWISHSLHFVMLCVIFVIPSITFVCALPSQLIFPLHSSSKMLVAINVIVFNSEFNYSIITECFLGNRSLPGLTCAGLLTTSVWSIGMVLSLLLHLFDPLKWFNVHGCNHLLPLLMLGLNHQNGPLLEKFCDK